MVAESTWWQKRLSFALLIIFLAIIYALVVVLGVMAVARDLLCLFRPGMLLGLPRSRYCWWKTSWSRSWYYDLGRYVVASEGSQR